MSSLTSLSAATYFFYLKKKTLTIATIRDLHSTWKHVKVSMIQCTGMKCRLYHTYSLKGEVYAGP